MEEKNKSLFWACVCFIIFLVIAYFVKVGGGIQVLDNQVSEFFVSRQSAYGIQIMWTISFLSSVYVLPLLVIIVSLVFYYAGKKKESGFYFFTFVFGAVINEFIKYVFGRIRPESIFEHDFSFPSIHASLAIIAFFGLSYLLWEKNRKAAYGLVIFGLIVGFSRIYLNVHWLSDVIAGFALGAAFLFLGIWLFFSRKD